MSEHTPLKKQMNGDYDSSSQERRKKSENKSKNRSDAATPDLTNEWINVEAGEVGEYRKALELFCSNCFDPLYLRASSLAGFIPSSFSSERKTAYQWLMALFIIFGLSFQLLWTMVTAEEASYFLLSTPYVLFTIAHCGLVWFSKHFFNTIYGCIRNRDGDKEPSSPSLSDNPSSPSPSTVAATVRLSSSSSSPSSPSSSMFIVTTSASVSAQADFKKITRYCAVMALTIFFFLALVVVTLQFINRHHFDT